MNDYNKQLSALDDILAQNFNDTKALAKRGEIYRLMGRYQEALADFTQIIKLKDNYAWAFAHRGETYYLMGAYEEALGDLTQAIELKPDYIWALAHRGVIYERLERYEETIIDLNKAIDLEPKYAWAFAYRCRAYEMMRDYEKAIIDFDRAIALDETIIKDWITERGLLLSFLRKYEPAMQYYERALLEEPNNHFTLYCIAVTKTRWKGITEAKKEIKQARIILDSSKTDNPEARGAILYESGGLAALENDFDKAWAFLEQAISLDYLPRRRALHDLAWLEFYNTSQFKSLFIH
jgi:tetratricopeptide (TPR) repeat protein